MNFESTLNNWCTEIQALRTSMRTNSIINSAMLLNEYENLQKFLEKNCPKKSDEEKYIIKDDIYASFIRMKQRIERLEAAKKNIPRMFIISLICQYDSLVGTLVRLVLLNQPNLLNNSEKSISFKELLEFKDINDAKEQIVLKEIEGVLRNSHKDQLKWFESKLGITLQSDNELLKKFYEITERRNLFAHNNGVVNKTYLNNCNALGCEVKAEVGDILDVSPEYFKNAVDCVLEIGIKITLIIWRHLNVVENLKTESITNSIAYDLIDNGNYDLAIRIINFALKCYKSFQAASNKLMLIINLAQCYLWKGNNNEVIKLLNEQDWSLCQPEFVVCKKVLERKFEEAVDILQNQHPDISQNELLEWPIFKELRKNESFKKFFSLKYSISIEDYSRQLIINEKNN